MGFLQRAVKDDRFTFARWDVHNPAYNPGSTRRLTPSTALPVAGTFDAIWMFSVVTHLDPDDTDAMFAVLRRAIRPGGTLLFSTFLDDSMATFREDNPQVPSAKTYYNEGFLRTLLSRNGRKVPAAYALDPTLYIADHFVCEPAS